MTFLYSQTISNKYKLNLDPIVFQPSYKQLLQIKQKYNKQSHSLTDFNQFSYFNINSQKKHNQILYPSFNNDIKSDKNQYSQQIKSKNSIDYEQNFTHRFLKQQNHYKKMSTIMSNISQQKQDLINIKDKLNQVIQIIDKKLQKNTFQKYTKISPLSTYESSMQKIICQFAKSQKFKNNLSLFKNIKEVISNENIQPSIHFKPHTPQLNSNINIISNQPTFRKYHHSLQHKPDQTPKQAYKYDVRTPSLPKQQINIIYKTNPERNVNKYSLTHSITQLNNQKNYLLQKTPFSTNPTSPKKQNQNIYQSKNSNKTQSNNQQSKIKKQQVKTHKKYQSSLQYQNKQLQSIYKKPQKFSFSANTSIKQNSLFQLQIPKPFQPKQLQQKQNPFNKLKIQQKKRRHTQQSMQTSNFRPCLLNSILQMPEDIANQSIIHQITQQSLVQPKYIHHNSLYPQSGMISTHKLKKKGIQISQNKRFFQSQYTK